MATKLRTVLLLVFLHAATFYGSCVRECNTMVEYQFATNFRVYPDEDSIAVGDTIWMDVNIPVDLRDVTTGSMVHYSEARNFGGDVQFYKLGKGSVSDPGATPAAAMFTVYPVFGNEAKAVNLQYVRAYFYEEISGRCRFQVGIIPLEKGDFMIALGDAIAVSRSKRCERADFLTSVADTDSHIYLYEASRPGYEVSPYEREHCYFFRVK